MDVQFQVEVTGRACVLTRLALGREVEAGALDGARGDLDGDESATGEDDLGRGADGGGGGVEFQAAEDVLAAAGFQGRDAAQKGGRGGAECRVAVECVFDEFAEIGREGGN